MADNDTRPTANIGDGRSAEKAATHLAAKAGDPQAMETAYKEMQSALKGQAMNGPNVYGYFVGKINELEDSMRYDEGPDLVVASRLDALRYAMTQYRVREEISDAQQNPDKYKDRFDEDGEFILLPEKYPTLEEYSRHVESDAKDYITNRQNAAKPNLQLWAEKVIGDDSSRMERVKKLLYCEAEDLVPSTVSDEEAGKVSWASIDQSLTKLVNAPKGSKRDASDVKDDLRDQADMARGVFDHQHGDNEWALQVFQKWRHSGGKPPGDAAVPAQDVSSSSVTADAGASASASSGELKVDSGGPADDSGDSSPAAADKNAAAKPKAVAGKAKTADDKSKEDATAKPKDTKPKAKADVDAPADKPAPGHKVFGIYDYISPETQLHLEQLNAEFDDNRYSTGGHNTQNFKDGKPDLMDCANGPKTQKAIALFKKEHHIAADAKLDEVEKAIAAAAAALKPSATDIQPLDTTSKPITNTLPPEEAVTQDVSDIADLLKAGKTLSDQAVKEDTIKLTKDILALPDKGLKDDSRSNVEGLISQLNKAGVTKDTQDTVLKPLLDAYAQRTSVQAK